MTKAEAEFQLQLDYEWLREVDARLASARRKALRGRPAEDVSRLFGVREHAMARRIIKNGPAHWHKLAMKFLPYEERRAMRALRREQEREANAMLPVEPANV